MNEIVGTSIPNEYIGSIEKAFYDIVKKGPQTGYPIINCKYVLQDGQTHPVDSSSNAFGLATKYSFAQAMGKGLGVIQEPIMKVEVNVPAESYVIL